MSADLRLFPIELAREAAFTLGGLDVRPAKLEVVSGDRRESLEPRIMQVLVALARQRGEVVSRDDLIQSCWGGRIVGEDAIHRCIFQLRRLADQLGGFEVETIKRVGYRLAVHDDIAGPAARPLVRRPAAVALGALLLVIVAAAGWWLIARHSTTPAATSVAVLPLDSPGGSTYAQAFAEGLLDEILGTLSNDHLQTVSRTESAVLRRPNAGPAIDRLGVGLLLDGSVEEANGSIKVRLHLDDPERQAIIWSEAFSRPASEADALQAEVAAKAARITSQAVAARTAGVSDPATLSDFVLGDEHGHFDGVGGPDAAEPFLRRVIAHAPRFAGGHANLAITDAFQSRAPGNPRAAEQRAEAAREAQAALKLDRRGYGAFLALALITPIDGDYWRAHEATLQTGMALDPTEPGYPYFLSEDLAAQGRLLAASQSARRAVALDPFWPGMSRDLALYLMLTGQADEGQQVLARMQRLWPGSWATNDARFWAAALGGDPGTAAALLDDAGTRPAFDDSRNADLWRTALGALRSGRADARAKAAAAIRTAAGAGAGHFAPAPAVLLLAQLGDIDGAFAVADRFAAQVSIPAELGGRPVLFVPQTAPLRRDPRFMRLAARTGLVGYWRSTGNWPDFCAEPGLPYDCKAEAARVSSTPNAPAINPRPRSPVRRS